MTSNLVAVPADWSGKTQFENDLDESETKLDGEGEEADGSKDPSKDRKPGRSSGSKRPAEKLDKAAKKARRELEKPGLQVSLLTVLNLGVLAGVGVAAFKNWDKARWDRRVVSATVIGLGALFSSQGYVVILEAFVPVIYSK